MNNTSESTFNNPIKIQLLLFTDIRIWRNVLVPHVLVTFDIATNVFSYTTWCILFGLNFIDQVNLLGEEVITKNAIRKRIGKINYSTSEHVDKRSVLIRQLKSEYDNAGVNKNIYSKPCSIYKLLEGYK